jgi:hypothetical protein
MSREDHRNYDAALQRLRQEQQLVMDKTEKISSGDIALWFLAAFMALALFLAAPRTYCHHTNWNGMLFDTSHPSAAFYSESNFISQTEGFAFWPPYTSIRRDNWFWRICLAS